VIKLGRSFWWFLALTVISFTVSRLPRLGENPIYLRLAIALSVVLLFNGIWVAISMIGVTFTRTTQAHRKQVGNLFIEYYELRNQSAIPKIWVKISDQSELPGESSSCLLTWIGGYRSKTYDAYTRLERSGWFQLGPTMIETGDIFGLFRFQKVMPSQDKLLVIPYIVDIPRFPAPFGTLPGGRALRQKTLEVTPYAAGVREYVPGDPLRRIHWPTSARKQKLIVKEFEKDPMETVWMFVDADQSVHFDRTVDQNTKRNEVLWLKQQRRFQLPPSTEEYAVTIAASIAKYYIEQKREVGIATASQHYSILPPERGERQLGKILEMLAILKADGDLSLLSLVSTQINNLTRGSTIILVTPSHDDEIIKLVIALIERGLLPVVVLIDQASFGGVGEYTSLESRLVGYGILTFVIKYGQDLRASLESPQLSLDARLFYAKRKWANVD
jgi:uncharacterized protein (DUF58 family)